MCTFVNKQKWFCLIQDPDKTTPTQLKEKIERYWGVPWDEICHRNKKTERIQMRHFSMKMFIEHPDIHLSLKSIGEIHAYKGRSYDHATVLSARRAVNNQIETNKKYKHQWEAFSAAVLSNR